MSYCMTAPTMLDREQRAQSYFLISYSHEDGRLVDPLLTGLYNKGANYWYDSEMHIGDNWKQKVLNYLSIDNGCCGMLLFVGIDYILSESCGWELEQFLAKKKENPDFRAFVVLIDHTTNGGDVLSSLYKEAAQESLTRITAAHSADVLNTSNSNNKKDILDAFNDNKKLLNEILANKENLFLPLKESTLSNVCDELYRSVFQKFACSTNVKEVLSGYARLNELEVENETVEQNGRFIKKHYSLSYGKIVSEKLQDDGSWRPYLASKEANWTVYDYHNGKLFLLLKNRSIGFCGRILAKNKLDTLKNSFVLSENKDGKERKRLVLSDDKEGRFERIRFLYKKERESEELAEDINWALTGNYDPEANGYFFVMNETENGDTQFYYADRFSVDVYENVWRDEVASVVPVVEIKALVD